MTHPLLDDSARRAAIADHDRSLLVEAGAGSGKTALMAGRIALMLAEGIAPKSIAAVTFTELAASELLSRVRDFVGMLLDGKVPTELKISLPAGLSPEQDDNLKSVSGVVDEITCTTIHGFCQRLIKPYPVEADIDPGASVMDQNEGDLVFRETVDTWLRERLSRSDVSLLSEMVIKDVVAAMEFAQTVLGLMRRHRSLRARPSEPHIPLLNAYQAAVAAFDDFLKRAPAREEETVGIVDSFGAHAAEIEFAAASDDPASLIRLLSSRPNAALFSLSGDFLAYRKKGKWETAAKASGLSKADGSRLNDAAIDRYNACCAAWCKMMGAVSARVLAGVVDEPRSVIKRFQAHKRSVGLLDFDDLIFSARDLLQKHDEVRRALAARYAHVLVDEFQDTDPLQTEIFWRLCGDPAPGASADDWKAYVIRPGALFLVADPKQAIYRFRGADVAAYVSARGVFEVFGAKTYISTNFRSRAKILSYVNARFEAVLSAAGQPGFTALDPFHPDVEGSHGVIALDVDVGDATAKPNSEQRRDAEADAVAQMCARLIGKAEIADHKVGEKRLCRPGDIALLAPTGTDLWRYEAALERYGIPVATQAGKGLYRRQEIQDLIAITRVLADGRDTLAFGALLRGPLVGLTETQLLDIVWNLPRSAESPESLPPLNLSMPAEAIQDPYARDIVEKLQSLRRLATSTTPHDILSQAIDALRVRPILVRRHRGQAERALSNVDLYLSLATAYSVRGLRAFADAMNAAWEDEARAVEGRPDAQEEAVALYTMHASKGLEWPIVVPINTMTATFALNSAVVERDTEHFYCPIFGIAPDGHEEAFGAEKAEVERERVRLWYVAATRARELLVLPRPSVPPSKSAWMSLVDLALDDLPALDLSHLPAEINASGAAAGNTQTRASFTSEAEVIAAAHTPLKWRAPSRDEGLPVTGAQTEAPPIVMQNDDDEAAADDLPSSVQGGRQRGLVIHKMLEEVLNGETLDEPKSLETRAAELIGELGESVAKDAASGLVPSEIAGCISRALALPEVAALRATLIPELPVFASELDQGTEIVTAGIADATSHGADGKPKVIIDWKSDVTPDPDIVDHYRVQVRSYLASTGAETGLIVFVTTGNVVKIGGP
jgi:exodeoxyribonuclease-5